MLISHILIADVHLLKAVDFVKDQTFFLSQVEQNPLRRTMFPLATLYKSQVRDIITKLGMQSIASKKESTGICFIGNRKFADFIHEVSSCSFADKLSPVGDF